MFFFILYWWWIKTVFVHKKYNLILPAVFVFNTTNTSNKEIVVFKVLQINLTPFVRDYSFFFVWKQIFFLWSLLSCFRFFCQYFFWDAENFLGNGNFSLWMCNFKFCMKYIFSLIKLFFIYNHRVVISRETLTLTTTSELRTNAQSLFLLNIRKFYE